MISLLSISFVSVDQKQSSKGIITRMRSENMQQIYRRRTIFCCIFSEEITTNELENILQYHKSCDYIKVLPIIRPRGHLKNLVITFS